MRVFVTGGSGRIGRHLIAALIERGDQVLALARSAEARQKVEEAGAEALVGSLDDAEVLARACSTSEVVFHLAGGVRGKGQQTPHRLNVEGTQALLAAGPKRLLFVSSAAVYGDRSNLWVEEDFEPSPNTRYGRSKAEAEALVRAHGDHTIVRLAAVYGPGFEMMMEQRIRAGQAWLPGEGRNFMPLIHVDDAVAALLHVQEEGGIWHVAGPEQPSLGEFFAHVHRALGKGRPVRFWSTWLPSYLQQSLARNNERLQSRIGGRPRFTPDALKLWTASVRLRTDKLRDSGFQWRWPLVEGGVRAAIGS